MHLALAQLFVIFFVFISEINRKKKMTVVCPSTTRPVLNDFDWVENAGILSSFIPVEKCPSVMTLDCVQKHVASTYSKMHSQIYRVENEKQDEHEHQHHTVITIKTLFYIML